MNFTRLAKKSRVKSRAKTANEDNPFSIYRARDCNTTNSYVALTTSLVEFGPLRKIIWGCIGMGRQILNHHKRCIIIREEDYESNIIIGVVTDINK
jgi:hypothetical protein